ncbi:complement C1q-like protein 2 [Mytilus californianus]|uniref:complement C1q-like protein 2 n=1 Tax=Mytilus californianus TaxID=6549 RepID=UPI0022462CE9|nr:complement C1q-like protein 2 [Mytilus californianus]
MTLFCIFMVFVATADCSLRQLNGRIPTIDGKGVPLTVDLDVSEFNKNLETIVKEDLVAEINDKFSTYINGSRITELVENVCKHEITLLKQDLMKEIKNKPAFFAFLKSNTIFSGDNVLKFDEVTTNIGQNYNPSTGVFTAPKEGVYQISCVMVAGGRNNIHYWLYKNKERFSYGYTSPTAHANSNTQNWILELKKGDRVFIQHRGSPGEVVHGLRHSYFSGHLLF